jgi:hypothetical protein
MAKNDTRTSNDRGLLLNAEPFGFGPTAAIADFFPHLRQMFGRVGYIGTGHTLDLQTKLPYDTIHGVTGTSDALIAQGLRELRDRYDVMLTALDFGMAEKALNAGFRVVIYDPLTWYWREIPPIVNDPRCLYVAQDFFGVRERCIAAGIRAPQVVAPIVDAIQPVPHAERQHVLLNLGGLANPHWSAADTLAYARLMVDSFVSCTGGQDIVIAANAALAKEFASVGARNYSREEMQEVLRKARYAFMTPGLGNIYDAARFGTPTIWLPPANDSQGQQRDLLRAHGRLDGAIDWQDFLDGAEIDYRGDQQLVLRGISAAVVKASRDKASQSRFAALMARLSDEAQLTSTGNCSALLDDFGSGGAVQVANLVLRFAKEGLYARV